MALHSRKLRIGSSGEINYVVSIRRKMDKPLVLIG